VPAPVAPPVVLPTATLDTALAGAAAATTEVAPVPAVPIDAVPVDPEPAGAAPADPTPRSRRPLLLAVATVVLAALAGLVTWLAGADARDAERADRRRAGAVAQSRQLALNLVSIDYRTLDRDLQRIADSTTGKARSEFDEKILKNEPYKKLVTDNQAVLTSTIKRIGLEPCGADDDACQRGDRATVLVFLDQESKNKLRPTPRVDRNRVVLSLVRHADRWLVDEVTVI
jgi:Mce-associated membrane protein